LLVEYNDALNPRSNFIIKSSAKYPLNILIQVHHNYLIELLLCFRSY
jgi:hypothetical protein